MNIPEKKKKKISVALILTGLFLWGGFQTELLADESQTEKNVREFRLNKEYLKKISLDLGEVYTAPGRWSKRDVLAFSLVMGSGLLLYSVDQGVMSWNQEQGNHASQDMARYLSEIGNGVFLSGFLVSLYAAGEIWDSVILRKTALVGLESWLLAGGVVMAVKFLVGRARPYADEGKNSFKPFSTTSRYYSFPSGHAASIFAVAAVVAQQSQSLFVEILSYTMASLVAVARVHSDKHWPSDILIGSVLGYVIGKKVSDLNKGSDWNKIRVGFNLSPQMQGITLSYSF